MKKLVYTILITISFVCLYSCSKNEEPKIEKPALLLEFKTITDISYGSDSKQTYDIYLPKERTLATKVIVLVHGGGWTSGDKNDMNAFKDFILRDLPNIAVVNMNYTLANDNVPVHPTQVNDITSVIDHLKDNRNEYQISDDIGFIGVSAGGHLALLWSYAFDLDNKVKMVCSIVGPTNLRDEAYLNSTNPEIQDLLSLYGEDLSFLKEISPLFQVTATAPPTILFYGGQDPLVSISQSSDLSDKLEVLGVIHEFTLYENEGHGWVGVSLFDTSVKLKAFIEVHL